MNIIYDNWQMSIVLVILLSFGINLIIHKRWSDLRSYAYKLIRYAEYTIAGGDSGRQKFDYVLTTLYTYFIPVWLRIFVSKEFVRSQLQAWFNDVKDYLDDGKINKSLPVMISEEDKEST